MFELFITFFKIGIMTFGGGLAMLPMLERELVDNKQWIDRDTLMNYYAIGQCTPGVIAVNVATFVGKKQKGFWGAFFTTLGVVTPSILIITIIAAFFRHFSDIEAVQHAFAGARVAVCVVVLNSVIKLCKKNIKDKVTLIVYLLVATAAIFFDISPVILVLIAGVVGIIFEKEKEASK